MAINFPDSPSNGDTFTASGKSFVYNSTTQSWSAVTSGSAINLSSITSDILPDADSSRSLGSSTKKWKDLHLSGNTIFLGDSGSISASTGGEIILPSIKIGTGNNAVKLEADATGKLKTKSIVSGVTQAAEEPGNATIVSDMTGLVAITGMTAGQIALVTSLNKVFMYTGSAWFLIATMTNSSPTAITGVDGSYTLATDGTATTVTVASTDPEGFPLTFSHAVTAGSLTNGGGTTATVTQGTGASSNVFTITPTTTEAYAGTFSLTFSVTDGATGAVNAVSAFTLAFAPQQIGSDTVYTTGSGTYSIPSGANYVKVFVTGGGGGGGGTNASYNWFYHSGGGGAGGTVIGSLAVSAGGSITYTVGGGGTGGYSTSAGTDGGDSTLNYNGTDFAIGLGGDKHGGNSGNNTSNPGGAGGSATHTGMVSVTIQNGGAGGASIPGGSGTGGDGGTSYYGAGGAGGAGNNGSSASTTHYGAGGGGAGSLMGSRSGGAGAGGYIVIQAWTGAP
tara:strand:- start:390 stop:1907 length:1518 start_codon:yes stop_codon:yes gene_type:complete